MSFIMPSATWSPRAPSNKPTNALPSLLRAQTSAASLAATLEVLSRFVTVSMQTGARSALELQIHGLGRQNCSRAACCTTARHAFAAGAEGGPGACCTGLEGPALPRLSCMPSGAARAYGAHRGGLASEPNSKGSLTSIAFPRRQELHRRANRVAKVSMQDIKCSGRSRCA